jgi:hypothetical protein
MSSPSTSGRFALTAAHAAQTILDAMEGVTYVVDQRGVILAAGHSNWNTFSADNGAPDLDAMSVLGRVLSDSVGGVEVKQSYDVFAHAILSEEQDQITFIYRCDAPEIRREMRLCISPLRHGSAVVAILYQSLIISEQDRPRINLFDPARIAAMTKIPPDAVIATVCSYCHDVRLRREAVGVAEQWVAPEDYYRIGGLSDVWVSHGICPPCHDRLVAPLLAERG